MTPEHLGQQSLAPLYTKLPEQFVGLLIHIGGDVDRCLILLHKLQKLAGVQIRISIIKIL